MRFNLAKLSVAAVLAVASAMPAMAGKAKDTLIWTVEHDVPTVDPYYAQVRAQIVLYHNVCDSLLDRDPKTLAVKPHLAKSWKWISPTAMEFELREDVKFHNGKKFGAEDVVYTFNHVTAPGSGVIPIRNVSWIKNAEQLGPYKVRVHLKKPFPAAPEYLAGVTPILPKGHYDKAPPMPDGKRKDYGAVPLVCTGPYKVQKINPGKSVELVANPDYFGGNRGKPSIKHILYRVIPDRTTQLAELLAGGVDWIQDIDKDKVDHIKKMGRFTVIQTPTLRVRFIRFETRGVKGKHPFMDVRVRRAVNHAINRRAMADALIGGGSEVIHAACHPSQFGCTQDVPKYDYDPAKAKKLLAEAGYPNGFTTDLWAFRERSYSEALVGELARVGIRVNLKFMQWRAVRPLMHDGTAYFLDNSWGSFGINDVVALPGYFFAGEADDGAKDPEVVKQIQIGNTSVDPEVRKAAYRKALVRIAEEALWAPMFTYAKFYAFTKDLDFQAQTDDMSRFWLAKWK
ncbi:MAG: ABC transporter substrate-binding protein [Hyphomicrobiaceae bacterium]